MSPKSAIKCSSHSVWLLLADSENFSRPDRGYNWVQVEPEAGLLRHHRPEPRVALHAVDGVAVRDTCRRVPNPDAEQDLQHHLLAEVCHPEPPEGVEPASVATDLLED